MKIKANIREALTNLFSARLRSLLALLGILVGTASVVAMVSGGKLATNAAIQQFKTLGVDLLSFSINSTEKEEAKSSGKLENLTLNQANGLKKIDSDILDVVPYTQFYYPIQFNGQEIKGSGLGVTDSFAQVMHVGLEKGRFISILDGYAFFCVIGHEVYQQIKKITFLNPIGQQIQIGKHIFTIIGMAKPWPENNFIYTNVDNTVMIPLLSSTIISKQTTLNNIVLKLAPNSDIDQVKAHVTNYMTEQLSDKSLYFRSPKELIARMTKQSEILTLFLGLIGSISLLVGGIGVMNIMLVSIVERKREIGIRLAVGATSSDIRSLFLVEAVILSLIGGVLGVVIGVLIAYFIALFSHWEFTLFLLPPVIGFSVSALAGIFFGFYPAYKASKLDPIEALKAE